MFREVGAARDKLLRKKQKRKMKSEKAVGAEQKEGLC